jgi:hypothetical protein
MTPEAERDSGAERELGTVSLEAVREKIIRPVVDDGRISWLQQRKIIKELDFLIENEKRRREALAIRQSQLEELEHEQMISEKRAAIFQKYAEIISSLRLLRARTDRAVARYVRDSLMCKLDIVDRTMQMRAKYKPVEKEDNHKKELLEIKRQQKYSEAREQAILDSISKKAINRAAFIKMVNEKFPDLAEELLDFYDQQLFQQKDRR